MTDKEVNWITEKCGTNKPPKEPPKIKSKGNKMTDKEIIIDGLGCNNCPEKKHCGEQQKRKNNIINLILDDIYNTAEAYHCDLKDKISILKQNLPLVTYCDVVLEKQLQREKQEKEQILKEFEIESIKDKETGEKVFRSLAIIREKQKNEELREQLQAYKEDRFCQGGCVVYQYDKIHKLKQTLKEIEENIKIARDLAYDSSQDDPVRVQIDNLLTKVLEKVKEVE